MTNNLATAKPRILLIFLYISVSSLYVLFLASSVDVMLSMHAASHPQVMTTTQELPQSDFARFWYVGRELYVHRLKEFGVNLTPSSWFKSTFQVNILSAGLPSESTWLYPPTMGIIAIPFSLIPLSTSFWAWQIITITVATFCLRYAGLYWLTIITGIASPAGLINILGGQNGILTAGFLVSGLFRLGIKQKFSGILLGLLCIKPQIAVAIPIILVQKRYRRAFIYCVATVLIMVIASLILEGWTSWFWFATISEPAAANLMNTSLEHLRPSGCSVFMMARSFGLTIRDSWTLQLSVGSFALILIYVLWRSENISPLQRMALTVCLSFLITPYGYIYDLVSFSIAMSAMATTSSTPLRPLFAFFWLLGGYTGTIAKFTGFIILPIIAVTAACLIWHDQQKNSSA